MSSSPSCTSIPNVLITHSLSEDNQHLLRSNSIQPLVFPALKTTLFPVSQFGNQINKECNHWVFTSKNAVKAVSQIQENPFKGKTVFAVGSITAEYLNANGAVDVIVSNGTAKELAERIQLEKIAEIVHFCGEFRRDELNTELSNRGILLNEVVCYTTSKSSFKISLDTVKGISFASPRSVEAFFDSYKLISEEIICFAIGDTTKNAIQYFFPKNRTITSKDTNKSVLSETILHFFTN